MRVWLAVLVLTLGASAARAQMGVPFGGYEPGPAYLGLGHNDLDHCAAAEPTYPYNRDVRRGGQPSSDRTPPPPDCPAH
jgi:hypothetical protein